MSTEAATRQQEIELYWEIERFLVEEAAHMDAGRYESWLAMLHEDFLYRVPVPVSREDPALSKHDEVLEFANESKSFLTMRFNRVSSDFAWAEHPAAYIRHFVTNFRIEPAARPPAPEKPAWLVKTNVLVMRSRLPEPPVLVSAERHDIVERAGDGFLLRRREVFLDVEVPTESQLGVIF